MPTIITKGRQFDARPDRIDFRDRLYRPPLVALPAHYPTRLVSNQYLPRYQQDGMILDQGSEGACTGFGLAAVINYVFWERAQREGTDLPAKVSPRMLYQTAKLYDEWQGEDYEGSSCRGAMKGWHRHGVCSEELWPYWVDNEAKFVEPKAGWENDASTRPLGAYYRINKDSIVDMQAAINEVHAIYVAAYVHQGWFLKKSKTLPVIKMSAQPTGGHAFAIVGYNEHGFIVQNSWGGDWGYNGFAIMLYADWVQNGMDAWVTLPGAPIQTGILPSTRQSKPLQKTVSDAAPAPTITLAGRVASTTVSRPIVRWSESEAYRHTVVLGNEGDLLNRLLAAETPDRALEIVAFDGPTQWLQANGNLKLALYAHGGLNDEEASINRIRVMAPYFEANGIYPLFITWRTGVWESLLGIIEDAVRTQHIDPEALRAEGLISDIGDAIVEAKDRAIEAIARRVLGKAIWSEMKQNAATAANREGGLNKLATQLARLARDSNSLEFHLIGHSAGSILLGHLLTRFITRQLSAASMTLYAPACTVGFANDFYGKAIEKKSLNPRAMHIDILDDELELDDSVGPYGKSLLYLVSRALEDVHKMPLLGMAHAWEKSAQSKDQKKDVWNEAHLKDVKHWLKKHAAQINLQVHSNAHPPATDGREIITRNHGHFDNAVQVITTTLERIVGGQLQHPVESLQGF